VLRRVDGVERVYLILPAGEDYGSWQLPKGRIDYGETEVQAAIREVREETGVTALLLSSQDESYLGMYGGEFSVSHFYLMRYVSGSTKVNEEVREIRLLSFDDAFRLLRSVSDVSSGSKRAIRVLTDATIKMNELGLQF
jgi:8-oxo-dGTP pyrophosphatase MutT (NUDIX family)